MKLRYTRSLAILIFVLSTPVHLSSESTFPEQAILQAPSYHHPRKFYDVQAHRGGRGHTIENTLPSFAWGLIDGATTLELDNGVTEDGVVVVWHDEAITAAKCRDTSPAYPDDPDFPYVGKLIANLTLAQLKTLDCGSMRQHNYPLQMTYPGTRISTLQEVFDFAKCADPARQILWNIESKIDAQFPNRTFGVRDFVEKQYEVFSNNNDYKYSITYQSFDWRTLIAMKALDPQITISALIDSDTANTIDRSISPWLGGLNIESFGEEGSADGIRIAQAAKYIGADILSPAAEAATVSSTDINDFSATSPKHYEPFTTREMIEEGHRLGLRVVPWTVNKLDIAEQLIAWKADGIITDYPISVRRLAKKHGLPVAPKYPKQRVLACLEQHLQISN